MVDSSRHSVSFGESQVGQMPVARTCHGLHQWYPPCSSHGYLPLQLYLLREAFGLALSPGCLPLLGVTVAHAYISLRPDLQTQTIWDLAVLSTAASSELGKML